MLVVFGPKETYIVAIKVNSPKCFIYFPMQHLSEKI